MKKITMYPLHKLNFILQNVEFYSDKKKYFTYLKSFKSAFEYAQLE